MQDRQITKLDVLITLIVVVPWITPGPVLAADPIAAELSRETLRLINIVREEAEESGLTNSPIMVSIKRDYQLQWQHQRCSPHEALVPFTTSGPGSAVWNYVALFRLLPVEMDMEAEMRREYHRRPKHVALVTFELVSEPFGLIDWKTAHVEAGHVLVQTRHWRDGDGHSNPSGPGSVRIDLDGGLKLTNLP